MAGPSQRDKPRNLDRFHYCRLVPERTDRSGRGNPTFGWPTQSPADVLDLPPQIVIRGAWRIRMAIMMPASDQAVLDRRDAIVAALRAIVPGEGVIDSAAEMLPYESDGLMAYRQPPMVVVLPDTTEQVSKVLKYCYEQGIKVVPRGSGTSLSGGALPLADGVLLGLGKFKRIREIDFDNRVVVTEPGRHQPRDQPGGGACRLLLRARSVVADRLLDRRQCRGEFRRGALPEIRHDHQQRARLRDRADVGRDPAHRRQGRGELRLRSDGHHHRFGRACSASSPRSRCGSCRSRRRRAP